jgi:hypothetical protein
MRNISEILFAENPSNFATKTAILRLLGGNKKFVNMWEYVIFLFSFRFFQTLVDGHTSVMHFFVCGRD